MLLFGFICMNNSAQSLIVGCKYGFYNPFFLSKLINPNEPALKYASHAFNTGLTCEIPLKGNHTSFCSGVLLTNLNVSYITIPATLKIHFGKYVKTNITVGVYNSFLAGKTKNYKSFDFGLNPGIGFSYGFKTRYGIFIEYQHYYGTKTAYNEVYTSHWGTLSYMSRTHNYGFYNVGLTYKIIKERSKK
jgi:hypothetical protein